MSEYRLYTSDPFKAGYSPVKVGDDYEFQNEDGCLWEADVEYEDFKDEYGKLFSEAPGWIARGSCKDWEGISPGGKVFIDWDFDRIMSSFFANTDGYGGLTVTYDAEKGEFQFRTENHDGWMEMTVRQLSAKGRERYLSEKDMFARIDLEGELFDNPEYTQKTVLEGF